MLRTGFSTIIKESQDFTFAIFDAQGRMVAQGIPQPLHIGPLAAQVNEIRRRFAGRRAGRRFHRQSSLPGLPEPFDRRDHHHADVRRRPPRWLYRQHRAQARSRRQGAGHQRRRRHRSVPGGAADPADANFAPRRTDRRSRSRHLRQYAHAGSHLGRYQRADQHQYLRPHPVRRAVQQVRHRQGARLLAELDGRSASANCARRSPRCRTAFTARRPIISTTTASISTNPIASRRRSR